MRRALAVSFCLVMLGSTAWLQEVKTRPDQPAAAPAMLPNSEPTYLALRKVGLSGETVSVANFTLKRDAGVFTFRNGVFQFLAPINGKVTGAVFLGDGSFSLVPPIASEFRVLALLTKEPRLEESFGSLVLRFTDASYEEIKKGGTGPQATGGGVASSPVLDEINGVLREKLNFNLAARILQDVLSPRPGGLFVAFIKGRKYSDKMLYLVDPHGVPSISPDIMPDWQVAPEEVALTTYEPTKNGVWAAFHFSHEYASGEATGTQKNHVIDIEHQQLDTSIEKGGKLSGKATTTFVANADGLRVVPLELYRTLRVQSVTDSAGQPLHFIQEDKNDDPDFAVILPKALAAGERYAITTTYAGKEVVWNEGGGNYYPIARSNWYPNSYFGDYATYEMTFRVPKGLKMVATGTLASEIVEGDESISRWRTEVPQAVAGFNFGKFKREEFTVEQLGYLVESYANKESPNVVREIQQMVDPAIVGLNESRIPMAALGSMDTTLLMKKALAEAQLSVMLFTDYFGPSSYKRLAVTQQTAFNYGQAWPGVVWLPISYFFDSTVRHQLGMDDPRGYFKTVGPHEVAHQWWGHTVGFHSYRDQWISEGFAEMAASLFIQMIQKKPQEFIKFWDDQSWLLTEKNKEGFRPIDAGPVTLGYRLATTKSGFDIPRRLIYPKGGYILHMVRMMMWSPQTGDDAFKAMLRDFVRTYANRAATTEDFKKTVEKHMTRPMNVRGDGKMDWFFDEYVYGTALPAYRLEHSFSEAPEGPVLSVKVRQSNVDDKFTMIVPLYLELASGKVFRLGSAAMTGNATLEQKVPLRGLPEKPKRAMLNYFNDVLCTMEK